MRPIRTQNHSKLVSGRVIFVILSVISTIASTHNLFVIFACYIHQGGFF